MRASALGLALAVLLLGGAGAEAQSARPPARFAPIDTTRHVSAPLAGLLSAALPGAGEYFLGLDRWVPMVALEAFGWWEYRAHRRDARGYERRYRQLACNVARRGFFVGTCRDSSDFEYYERMGKPRWSSSGAWDLDPGAAGIQPEADTFTFNGHVWAMANQLYPSDSRAMTYYMDHAIPETYGWNWGGNTLEQTYYDELIKRGDDSFRTSSRILGLILANHVISAVDAYIAARLKELAHAPRVEVRSGFEPGAGPLRWRAGVTIVPGGPARP